MCVQEQEAQGSGDKSMGPMYSILPHGLDDDEDAGPGSLSPLRKYGSTAKVFPTGAVTITPREVRFSEDTMDFVLKMMELVLQRWSLF